MTLAAATPQPASFYVTGGTLPPDAPSYVERQADIDLYASLLASETCYVLNSRQMGKSSLCVRTLNRLKANGVRTAFCDLTRYGGKNLTAEQWYASLLSDIGREVGLRPQFLSCWKENAAFSPVQRLFEAITEVALFADAAPIVIFIDEIDVTLSLPFSTDEFFAAIRRCYVGRVTEERLRRLSFCLLGTAAPADLIQDTRVSPFNIGKRIELRDFTEAEAAPLAAGLALTGDSLLPSSERRATGKELISRVLYWTSGHPYLTQRLCRTALETEAKTPDDVDQLCADLFLTQAAQESDDNLAFVRNRMLKSEADLASLLDLYGGVRAGRPVPDDDTNALGGILKLSGVLKQENGYLKVRNRIYAQVFDRRWVTLHMPDAELRRQRAAYRQGIIKVALPGAWIVLLPLLAGTLMGDQPDRTRMTVAFVVYGIFIGTVGFVTLGSLFRPGSVSPRMLAGVVVCNVVGTVIMGTIFGEQRSVDDWSLGMRGWLRVFAIRILTSLLGWCIVSLSTYWVGLRKQRNLSPLILGYLAGASGLAAGYAFTMFVGVAFVRLGVMRSNGADYINHYPSWPLNSELNGNSLLVFMLSLFVAIPVSMALLNGIVGYSIGNASRNRNRSLSILCQGVVLYVVLNLLFNGVNNKPLKIAAIATTFLACVRYVSRLGDDPVGAETETP